MPAGPSRHERPAIDEAALALARLVEIAIAAARDRGAERWVRVLGPIPDELRDGELGTLRATARRTRAAYGPKDSIRDVIAAGVTEPLLAAIDRLLREIARDELDGQ